MSDLKNNLAAAYSIKKANMRKKKMMANGGPVSAKTEARPMPETKANDKVMVSRNDAKKPLMEAQATSRPDIRQSQKGPQTTKIKHPRMVPSNAFSARLRDEEDNLQMSASVNDGPQHQPPEHDNEMDADKSGPDLHDMQREHSNGRKPYAKGGEINNEVSMQDAEMDNDQHPAGLESDSDMMGDSHAMDDHMQMLAEGGELEEDHADSICAAIMAKRAKMADGGILSHDSIYADDSSQVDLKRNAQEDANEEDQTSFNALRKENYSESEGLDQLDQPMDSNEHGHELSDEDAHDMVSRIRSKMNVRRQFKG